MALGFFGGAYDFNNWPWWAGAAKGAAKKQLETAGFKAADKINDVRDWEAICKWAKELVRSISR